jgi:hypothetical protein
MATWTAAEGAHPASASAREELSPWPWPDTLAGLVRSHRARLAAPDPSRPWLRAAPPVPDGIRAREDVEEET